MQKKFLTTYILIGLLIVLGVTALIIKWPQSEQAVSNETVSLYTDYNKDQISKIEIIFNDATKTLIKEENIWYQLVEENNPASAEAIADKQEAELALVNTVLTKVEELRVEEPVTENADKKELFQVDESGTHVIYYKNNDEVVNFYIGKSTPGYSGVYVRKNEEDKIYEIDDRLNTYFKQPTFIKKVEEEESVE